MTKTTISYKFPGGSVNVPLDELNIFKNILNTYKLYKYKKGTKEKLYLIMEWCINHILDDQYDNPDYVRGAWSKHLLEYNKEVFGGILEEYSESDSISITTWNLKALLKVSESTENQNLTLKLNETIYKSIRYIESRQDEETGAFGKLSLPDMRFKRQIVPHLRHTIWAVEMLVILNDKNWQTDADLDKSLKYIATKLENNFENKEIPVTLSAFHKLITNYNISEKLKIYLKDKDIKHLQLRTEKGLKDNFNTTLQTWLPSEVTASEVKDQGVDVSLLILSTLNPSFIEDKVCKENYLSAINNLCDQLIYVNDGAGLPFKFDDEPDIGPTITLLWILHTYQKVLPYSFYAKKLFKFISLNSKNLDKYSKYSYSWLLAPIVFF